MKRASTKTRPARRATARTLRPFIDVESLPDVCCFKVDGSCLEPLVPHGARVVIKKSENPVMDDIVCIWFRSDVYRPAWVKRLTMNIPGFVKFPYTPHPETQVAAVLFTEQLNPPQRYSIPCEHVLAVHKVIGYVPADRDGENVDLGMMIPIGGHTNAVSR